MGIIELIDISKMKTKRREMRKKNEDQSLFIIQKENIKGNVGMRKRGDSIYISLTDDFSILQSSYCLQTHKYCGILSVHHPRVVGFSLDNLFENGLVPRFCRFNIGIVCSPT